MDELFFCFILLWSISIRWSSSFLSQGNLGPVLSSKRIFTERPPTMEIQEQERKLRVFGDSKLSRLLRTYRSPKIEVAKIRDLI